MPELFTDRETGPQRPDWLADDAVLRRTCLSGKKQGKIQGNLDFPHGKSHLMLRRSRFCRYFLAVRPQQITGKTVCDNREMHSQKQGKLPPPTATAWARCLSILMHSIQSAVVIGSCCRVPSRFSLCRPSRYPIKIRPNLGAVTAIHAPTRRIKSSRLLPVSRNLALSIRS